MAPSSNMDRPPPTSKVAIPRLRRPDHDHSQAHRARKACNNCRRRKAKCPGEQPHCRRCLDQDIPCVYSQTREGPLKRATDENSRLAALLKDLANHVDDVGRAKIDEHFASLQDDVSVPAPTTALEASGKRSRESSIFDEEGRSNPSFAGTYASGPVGSNQDLELQDEDLLRSHESRATGFVGNNSEVQWLRSLKTQMRSAGSRRTPSQLPGGLSGRNKPAVQRTGAFHNRPGSLKQTGIFHVSDSTFYLDRDDHQLEAMVDPYEMPPANTAERLFDCYLQTVHTSFPILPDIFEKQFRRYNDHMKQSRPYRVPEKWQGMLNLVLAIGAQHAHLIQAEWRGDERDHLVYMTRATKILGLDKISTLLSAPSLSLIQATGLLSLYHLIVGQVGRAWMMIGISLRCALAVGLHLRNDDPSALVDRKESLVRTWWSLHAIESLLCTLIGRPCVISNDDCTVPLPQALPEEQSGGVSQTRPGDPIHRRGGSIPTSSVSRPDPLSRGDSDAVARASFLGARVTLALIMQKALSKLYAPRTYVDSWERIQKEIGALKAELDEWAVAAQLAGLSTANSAQEAGAQRERLLLSFHYHSATLLVCRPCLCRLDRRITGQSDVSANFNQKTAEACVRAAQAITGLLPDQPDLVFIYQQGPWWCIVHNIMQAMAVFLLESFFEGTHNSEISANIEKLVRWLQAMSGSNAVADRAYRVVIDILKTCAPRVRLNISDILVEEEASVAVFTPGKSPPKDDSVMQLSNDLTKTPKFEPEYPVTFGGHSPVQAWEELQPYQFSMPEPSLDMPSVFTNPFLTSFDNPNPLLDAFPLNGDATINDESRLYQNPFSDDRTELFS